MPAVLPISFLAGLTSVVLYLGTASGSALGLLLVMAAPLPIFMAGLGWGSRAALGAGLIATVILTIFGALAPPQLGTWMLGPAYFITTAGTPILLSRLALLRRPIASQTGGENYEWYPVGHLLLWTAGLSGGALLVAGVLAYQADPKGLTGLVQQWIDILLPAGSDLRDKLMLETGAKDWEPLARSMARSLPAMAGLMWQLMTIANALIAQSLLTATRHAIRPVIGWRTLTLPRPLALVLVLALVGAFAKGDIGFMAGTLAAVLFVPYFFLGLTVIHAIPARGAGRVVLLGLIYVVLVMLISPAILI